MTTTKTPRTESLRTFPEDAETPAPVPIHEASAAPAAGKEVPPLPFRFDPDGKAYARAEDGTMVQVKLEAAQLAVNDFHAQGSPEVMRKAAASCAAQHAVKA
jgi:hypothetical protein